MEGRLIKRIPKNLKILSYHDEYKIYKVLVEWEQNQTHIEESQIMLPETSLLPFMLKEVSQERIPPVTRENTRKLDINHLREDGEQNRVSADLPEEVVQTSKVEQHQKSQEKQIIQFINYDEYLVNQDLFEVLRKRNLSIIKSSERRKHPHKKRKTAE